MLQGERDYSRLGGSTGPLVYPAGFLYIYTLLHWLSGGGRIVPAQWLFIFFYLITQVKLPLQQLVSITETASS